MSKVVQALLSGMFFTFIMDFFIFLGIKMHYIDANNIKEYYNVLFADHQNIFLFMILSVLLGYITMYKSNKLSLIVLGSMFALSLSTLISPIGEFVGKSMLAKSNVSLQTKKFSYSGDIIYVSRENVIFFDYKLNKILHINRNKIIGEY